MIRLSVNINKFATLRNSRGGNNPDVVKAAVDAQRFGADGVTVHPRPDERWHDPLRRRDPAGHELGQAGARSPPRSARADAARRVSNI